MPPAAREIHRGQLLALDELEKCAAAGGNVGDAVLDAVLLDGGERIATTRERERLAARDGVRQRARAFPELIELEYAHRAVPENRTGLGDQLGQLLRAVRADVENHLVARDFAHRLDVGLGHRRELGGHHDVGRHRNADPRPCDCSIRRRQMSSISRSCRDLPTLKPCAARNVFAMPPPTIIWSTLDRSASSTVSLVDTFEPPTIASKGRAGFSSAVSSAVSSLTSNGPAHAIGAILRHTVRARLRAMRGTERVHHVDIAERRHLARQLLIVLFLALVEAHVLEQHDLARGDVDAVQPIAFQRRRTPRSCVSRRPREPARIPR